MERVIVTGVTGKSGRAFLEKLIENADSLTSYHFGFIVRDRSRFDESELSSLNYAVYVGGLTDADFIDTVFDDGCDTLLHIAGISFSAGLTEAAVRHSVKRLIYVHTTGIYSKYKEAGEHYRQVESKIDSLIEDTEISLTILRPTMIYGEISDGNVVQFIKMADKLPVFPVVDGAKYELQPVHCEDLGVAFYSVLINPEKTLGKNYVLSGAEPILLIDMLRIIGKKLGKKMVFVSVPYKLAYFGACMLYKLTGKKKDYREKVQRLVEPRAYSHEDATRDFGYSPMDFEHGVAGEIDEYSAQKGREQK